MNLYGYAGGDPINNSDPFGLCPEPGSEEYTGETCFDGAAAIGMVLYGTVGSSRRALGRLAGSYRHAQALRRVARESAFADGAPAAENGALRREKLSEVDRETAQRLLDDLQSAMNTKP